MTWLTRKIPIETSAGLNDRAVVQIGHLTSARTERTWIDVQSLCCARGIRYPQNVGVVHTGSPSMVRASIHAGKGKAGGEPEAITGFVLIDPS